MRLSTHHVIHKFTLDLKEKADGVFTAELEMPSNAKFRKVAMQANSVCIWAQLDNEVKGRKLRKFLMVGTGREFDACKWDYVETFFDSQWVWHLYEERS